MRAEATPERDALRVHRRGCVERPRRGRLPVHDEALAVVVVDPAPPDVERPLERLEVEAAEAEPALGVLVGSEPPRRPGVERSLRHLAVRRVGGTDDDVAHVLQAGVGVVDVRLLRRELGVRHDPRVALADAA